jgi:protein-S-isoprenylcysteine O-methyltransferase Ste14
MMSNPRKREAAEPQISVIRWLLDSDPSIRWQVMRDLVAAPADEVAAERARVATEGAGARLLALQEVDGRWGGAAWNRGWSSTMHVLMLLRDMGLDPASDQARRAVGLVRDRVTWRGCGPQECDGNAFFEGEVEPCINGQVAAVGAYFGQDVRTIVDRLLAEQLPDGGWNCEAAKGSTRSSFNTTICVLEALLEYERAAGGSPMVTGARLRGQEYLLERRLFRRRSTGEAIERDRKGGASWTRFAFPTWWHYDVLRGLEYLRSAGVAPDERVAEAIDLVASKRDADGRWPLELQYAGKMLVETDEGVSRPSRWNTLRALRVLNWYSARDLREGPKGQATEIVASRGSRESHCSFWSAISMRRLRIIVNDSDSSWTSATSPSMPASVVTVSQFTSSAHRRLSPTGLIGSSMNISTRTSVWLARRVCMTSSGRAGHSSRNLWRRGRGRAGISTSRISTGTFSVSANQRPSRVAVMLVLARAATYSALFIGLFLVFLPDRILSSTGIVQPAAIGAWQVAGMLLGASGAILAITCVFTFVFAGRGTPAPFDPPRRLVVQGPYRLARNPMYLGAGFALSGAALFYQSMRLLGYAGVFVLAAHLLVVLYEEPTLRRMFGEDYDAYCRRVGRWWPKP